MFRRANRHSTQTSVMKLIALSTLSVVFSLGIAGAAGAGWDDRDHRPAHYDAGRHGDHRHGWNGGYYAAPPVVYGGAYRGNSYYPPPVVYGPQPGIGIILPGLFIGIH